MRRTQAPRPGCREDHRQPGDAGLHRAENAVGRGPRAGDRQGDEARASAQGLRAPAPQRRGGFGHVRRLRNVVARRRQARAGTSACWRRPASRSPRCRGSSRARRSRPISRPPSPRPGASKAARSRSPAGAATMRPPPSASARRRRATGFVSLGTSGVIFSVTDRFVSLPERTLHAFCHALPNRWHGMAVMLSAAASLAWIAGDSRARERGRRAGRGGAGVRPVEGGRRLGAAVPALSLAASARRTTTPRRRACSPAFARATAPTRSPSP